VGLREALSLKEKHNKKGEPLDLQQRQEYHDGAVLWSPSKVREARVRDRVEQRKEEAEKLKKKKHRRES
jgi:hypothetical protein